MKAASVTALSLVVGFPGASGSPLQARQNESMVFDFKELTPSPDLQWTPCYENFTCFLLEVPLNYSNPSVGTTHLDIIRLLSEDLNAEDLLVNSGGPGGSSVDMVKSGSKSIIAKVGTQLNIIGIDPRGVNNSGPELACFSEYTPAARNAFYAETFAVPDNTSHDGLSKSFQGINAYGEWCSGVYSVNGTAQYVSTVAVAQDFVHYIELAAKTKGCAPEEAKLYYYGISYGTVLGATFAALYPGRIARMLVDGVVDSEDYYNGGWKTAPLTTDEALRTFFKTCVAAGELCVFAKNSTSWEQLETRYLSILASLKRSPMAVANQLDPVTALTGLIPAVVQWQNLVESVFALLYFPVIQFPSIAQILSDLDVGNATSLYYATQAARIASPVAADPFDLRELWSLVACLDANDRFNTSTLEDYKKHIEYMMGVSQYGGLAVAAFAGPVCSKLNVSPPKRQAFEGVSSATETSAPILWLGNVADLVTPLRSAKKMAGLFAGSGVLAANVSGHTLFGVASKCVDGYTQQYMLDASLPPPDTTCEVDERPFFDN